MGGARETHPLPARRPAAAPLAAPRVARVQARRAVQVLAAAAAATVDTKALNAKFGKWRCMDGQGRALPHMQCSASAPAPPLEGLRPPASTWQQELVALGLRARS